MARRRVGQLGFADAALGSRAERSAQALLRISSLVEWDAFEKALNGIHSAAKGEKAYPPVVMFKALLLGRWYGLSDPGLEAALADRLSFMRFCGLSLDDPTPDHTTLWRFREALTKDGLLDTLFRELTRQLVAANVLVRAGTLIDASLVQSAARRPRMDEGKQSPTDPEARFGSTNERGHFTFGYKAHLAVDAGSALIVDHVVTPANQQDVSVAPHLLEEACGVVYADRGYDSDRLRAHLKERGLDDGLMRRTRRIGQALPAAEQERNNALSRVRRAIEKVFGTMKRSYRLGRFRAFRRVRNQVDVALFAIAYNLRRWHTLTTA
jgi:transposase, IS5 family